MKRHLQSWLLAASIFLAALFAYPMHLNPAGSLYRTGYESVELGYSLATQGTFSNPFFLLPTGPSAHVGPAYPAIVAVVIRTFGSGFRGYVALRWLSKITVALQLAMWPFLAEYLGLGWMTGLIAAAGFIAADFPFFLWETDFAGLLAVVLAFPMYKALRQKLSPRAVVVTGILWGVLLLFTPTPLPVLCIWILSLAWVSAQSKKQILVLAAIPLLMILPWLVRNDRVFHRPVFLRDNLGLELAIANNPCAEFSAERNLFGSAHCFSKNHPNASFPEALRLAALGEAEYNRVRLHEALHWIGSNRQRFLEMTTLRWLAFWLPNGTGNPLQPGNVTRSEMVTTIFTLLSIPGLLLMWYANRRAAWIMTIWLLFFPLVYYISQFDPRYRHPILWATFLPGSFVIAKTLSVVRAKIAKRTQGALAVVV